MNTIKICKVCGREVSKLRLGMCKKHYEQYHKYGKVLDNNPRTVWDDNEIRTYKDYGEINTYTNTGEVQNTFKFEGILYLSSVSIGIYFPIILICSNFIIIPYSSRIIV